MFQLKNISTAILTMVISIAIGISAMAQSKTVTNRNEFLSSATFEPQKNNLANDPTENTITSAVYKIRDYDNSYLVTSLDKSDGKNYSMVYENGKISHRIPITNNWQNVGFPNISIKMEKDDDSYALTSNGKGNLISRQRSFYFSNPKQSAFTGWFGYSSGKSVPYNDLDKVNLIVNYVDSKNKNIANSEAYNEYNGQTYKITRFPHMIGEYEYSSAKNTSGYLGNKDVNVNLIYKKVYEIDEHDVELDIPKSGQKYISGHGKPGDEIIITTENNTEIGRGMVDDNGNFKIETNHDLTERELIKARAVTKYKEHEFRGHETNKRVDYSPENHKPKLNIPSANATEVTGRGVENDEIIITDDKNETIGHGKVTDGVFTITTNRPLVEREVIKATPKTIYNGIDYNGDADTKHVDYSPENHTPTLEKMFDESDIVKGNGVENDTIIVKDSNGNELGRGVVNNKDKFSIVVQRPLSELENITAQAETNYNGENKYSYINDRTVEFNSEKHRPSIDKIVKNDNKVIGKGIPNDEITINDNDGDKLGHGNVDENGNFNINTNRPLNEKEIITVNPKTIKDGKTYQGQYNQAIVEFKKTLTPSENTDSDNEEGPDEKNPVDENNVPSKNQNNDNNSYQVVPNRPDSSDNNSNNQKDNGSSDNFDKNNNQSQPAQPNMVIHAIDRINMYKTPNAIQNNIKNIYFKKPINKSPMFKVIKLVKNKHNEQFYLVKDINKKFKTHNEIGFIPVQKGLTNSTYYQNPTKYVTVINPYGIYGYKNPKQMKAVKHYKQGTILRVNKLVKHNLTSRYKLSNGQYITGNRKYVVTGKAHAYNVKTITTKKKVTLYKDVNLKIKKGVLNKHITKRIKYIDYSNRYKHDKHSSKVYAVKGGFIKANKFVKQH
ncbi:Ig-like domain-containing protein [Apilactobacillus ozensis]|nr:Ig-like domain-containing protein [Apilactobacillus ozensis]